MFVLCWLTEEEFADKADAIALIYIRQRRDSRQKCIKPQPIKFAQAKI